MPQPSATPIVEWLLGDARALADPAGLLEPLSQRLLAQGVPIWRSTLNVPQLHPQLRGAMHIWHADGDGVETAVLTRQTTPDRHYHHSPVALMHRSRSAVRRRLADDGAASDIDFPVLEDLRARGGTDYALMPLPLAAGKIAGFGMTSRDADGFRTEHMALVAAVLPTLGTVLELLLERLTMRSLLVGYVGREAARRILSGQVTLSASRPIQAVIFFCDLRGFTALSETLPRRALLTLLNGFFGCMVGAIHRRDGEVLKFLGDGLLAIFRFDGDETVDVAAAKAIMASFEAVAALDAMNAERRAGGLVEARCGIALHVGPVLYGNVGTEDRLDFTVIGPVVNKASRLERLCSELNETILSSKEFAAKSPVRLRSLGRHLLKGLGEPQEVFAPDIRGGLT